MSSRYSACFSLMSPKSSLRSTCEKPLIAFSGVRSSCDMLARNSDLWRLAASSSRLFSSSSASAVASSRVRSSTCCSSPAYGRLQPGGHAVELVGEGAELVAAGDLDPLVERPGADLRRGGLDRLDGPGEVPGEQHARRDRHQEEHDQERRRPPDRRLDGRERLAQRLLDEHPPAGRVDALERAQDLRPLGIASVGDHALCRRGARPARRGPAAAPRGWCRRGRG